MTQPEATSFNSFRFSLLRLRRLQLHLLREPKAPYGQAQDTTSIRFRYSGCCSLQRWATRLGLLSLGLITVFLLLAGYAHSQTEPALLVTGTATDVFAGRETTYRLQLLNQTDEIAYGGVLSITLPTGLSYVPSSTMVMGHGWPIGQAEPLVQGRTLTWGPYPLPAAGIRAHNPYGIHTLIYCDQPGPTLHLEAAKLLAGSGGHVTQLFYSITPATTGPSQCAVNFVQEAYARNLIPIVRLGGVSVNGIWQAPDPGPNGDYAAIAQAFANFVAGLPRRDTNPLYVQIWNEPDLWIEWSNSPNAEQYGRFFVAVSNAIRRLGDARIRIVNGALTPGNPAFLERLLRVPGFRDAFDLWASHCYPYNHPPPYNNHDGTARHGTYAIDCYLQELALIQKYGRSGVKVLLTETGYELGDHTFDFEGFPYINETNRAVYMAAAFANYWQKWPEVEAVTPFELVDTTGQWARFDWLYPTPPYPRRPQFEAVAALPKPVGGIEPLGYQVIFRAKVGEEVAPGLYPSQLSGSDDRGYMAFAVEAAPVRVYPAESVTSAYLPLILIGVPRQGLRPIPDNETWSPGAIVPTAFLHPSGEPVTPTAKPAAPLSLALSGEPINLALHEAAGLGMVGLKDGRLEIVELGQVKSLRTITLGQEPQEVTPGRTDPASVYVAVADGVMLVDLEAGIIVTRLSGLGRLAGLAWDGATGRLFALDTGHDRLLVFRDDLSQRVAALPLAHQPDQLILDGANRHLYLTFPAVPQVIAVDAETLAITAQAPLTGGPLLDLAFDASRQRLYALNALAPRYRGLTVWETPSLKPIALVAGAGDFPLRTASTLALTPAGQLLVSETTGLWQIGSVDFSVRNAYPTPDLPPARALKVSHSGQIYVIEPAGPRLWVYN